MCTALEDAKEQGKPGTLFLSRLQTREKKFGRSSASFENPFPYPRFLICLLLVSQKKHPLPRGRDLQARGSGLARFLGIQEAEELLEVTKFGILNVHAYSKCNTRRQRPHTGAYELAVS